MSDKKYFTSDGKEIIGWINRGGSRVPITESWNSNREYNKSKTKVTKDSIKNMIKNKDLLDTSERNLHGTEPDSLGKWTDENGNLSGLRQSVHDEIIEQHFLDENGNPIEKADGQPTFYMMGGGPASGKSTLLKGGFVTLPENTIEIDPDAIKGRLPEYKDMVSNRNASAAKYTHEESSALSKQIMAMSTKESYNTMLDGTGDGSEKSLLKKINDARANGNRVEGIYVTVATDEAVRRSTLRSNETGREVPAKVIKKAHRNVSSLLGKHADKFDHIEVWDNNSSTPIKIATGGNGNQLKATKGNEPLLEQFLNKAFET